MIDAWVRAWKNHEGNRKESFRKKYRALKMDRIKEDIVMNILNLLSSFYNFSLTAPACARQRNSRAMIMQYLPLTWKEGGEGARGGKKWTRRSSVPRFCVNPMIDTSYVLGVQLCFRRFFFRNSRLYCKKLIIHLWFKVLSIAGHYFLPFG